jgi:hypothetical protein
VAYQITYASRIFLINKSLYPGNPFFIIIEMGILAFICSKLRFLIKRNFAVVIQNNFRYFLGLNLLLPLLYLISLPLNLKSLEWTYLWFIVAETTVLFLRLQDE